MTNFPACAKFRMLLSRMEEVKTVHSTCTDGIVFVIEKAMDIKGFLRFREGSRKLNSQLGFLLRTMASSSLTAKPLLLNSSIISNNSNDFKIRGPQGISFPLGGFYALWP